MESNHNKNHKILDGGWGWLVLFASFSIHFVMDGLTYSLGTYLNVFHKEFKVPLSHISLMYSLLPASTLLIGPIASIFLNNYGCRLTTIVGSVIASIGLIITQFTDSFYLILFSVGIIVGIGFGFMYVSAVVSVNFYFEKRRSMAMGIAVCGSGVGTFILTPINRYLIEEFGRSGGFLIKAAFVLNGCVFGMLMRPVPIEPSEIKKQHKLNPPLDQINNNKNNNTIKKFIQENIIDVELITNLIFLLYAMSNFLTSLGFNTPFIYIIDQALLSGIQVHKADWLLSLIGLSNVAGRIFFGLITNFKSVNRMFIYIVVLVICGLATVIEPFFTSYTGFIIYSIVFGLTSGGYVALFAVVMVDLFGLNKLTNAFGSLLLIQGLATTLGPPTVGAMYDMFASYVQPFVMTGVVIAASGFLCILIAPIKTILDKRKLQNSSI